MVTAGNIEFVFAENAVEGTTEGKQSVPLHNLFVKSLTWLFHLLNASCRANNNRALIVIPLICIGATTCPCLAAAPAQLLYSKHAHNVHYGYLHRSPPIWLKSRFHIAARLHLDLSHFIRCLRFNYPHWSVCLKFRSNYTQWIIKPAFVLTSNLFTKYFLQSVFANSSLEVSESNINYKLQDFHFSIKKKALKLL